MGTEPASAHRESEAEGAILVPVAPEEAGLRMDRWFKRHYPEVGRGRLHKWLRTGQVRIDGRRTKGGARLEAGQKIRVPPMGEERAPAAAAPPKARVSAADARNLIASVLYRDEQVLAVNKPSGLAVQGGTGTVRHLDAMLDALAAADKQSRLQQA